MRIAISSFIKWFRTVIPVDAKVYPMDFQTNKNMEPIPPKKTSDPTLWLLSFIGDSPSPVRGRDRGLMIQVEYLRADGQVLLTAEHLDNFLEASGLVHDPRHSIVTVPRVDYSQNPPKDLGEMVLRPLNKGFLWRDGPSIVEPVREVHKLATLELLYRRNS